MTMDSGGEPGLPDDVVAALRDGHKIEAIKQLREARGLDLKTAKEQVDAHLADHPGLMPEKTAAEITSRSGSSFCHRALVLLLLIVKRELALKML